MLNRGLVAAVVSALFLSPSSMRSQSYQEELGKADTVTLCHAVLLSGNGTGDFARNNKGEYVMSLEGEESIFGLCSEKSCSGQFLAETCADSGVNYGLAIVKESGGRPDMDNYLAVTVCVEDGKALVRAVDCQNGQDNILDNTGAITGNAEREFRYTVPLDSSYFSVPFRGATGKARIIRNDISGFFHLYIGVGKVINGKFHEGWIETAPIKDWNEPGTRFFVCPVIRLEDAARDSVVFSQTKFYEFSPCDIQDSLFSVRRRNFVWSGFPGEADVVSFDKRYCPASAGNRKFVFWSEANYVPAWHLDNELLFSYEFCETWASEGSDCYEPMSDRLTAYSYTEILEDTPVRKIVKYHYALINPNYEAPFKDGSYPEVDEYYTFYPDGVGVREIHIIQNGNPDGKYHEVGEPMIISGSGSTVAAQLCKSPAFVISCLSGENFMLYPDKGMMNCIKAEVPEWNEQIYCARLKNAPDIFCVFPSPDKYPGSSDLPVSIDLSWHNTIYQMSHFPVDKQKYIEARNGDNSKSNALWPSQVSHSSLIGIEAKEGTEWNDRYRIDRHGRKYRIYRMLFGISPEDERETINEFTRSWLSPGRFEHLEGLSMPEMSYSKREIVFRSEGIGAKRIEFSTEEAIRNSVFRIEGWSSSDVRIVCNGKQLEEGRDYLAVQQHDSLLIWFNFRFQKKNVIKLIPEIALTR